MTGGPLVVAAQPEQRRRASLFGVRGSYLGDGHVGLEALDLHVVGFDGQVGLARGDVQGTRGRALRLGQLVLLLACLALRGSQKQDISHREQRHNLCLTVKHFKLPFCPVICI